MAPAVAAIALSLTTHPALSCEAPKPYDAASVMRYIGFTPKTFKKLLAEREAERSADIAFARTHNAIVLEGPWDELPAVEVAYVGIDECGERVQLEGIAEYWRFSPVSSVVLGGGEDAKIVVRAEPGAVMVRRVLLGRPMDGMVVGRAGGVAPVQSHGVIDGKDYYFRSRGEHWSMSVGGSDIYASPDWYYEERYGTWPDAGSISAEQAYDFIERAAAKFRAGAPTMSTRTIDRGTQSILDAIQQMKPE